MELIFRTLAASVSYIWAEGGTELSQITLKSAALNMTTNIIAQGVANGGDLSKVNTIEVFSSLVPGIGPTIVGGAFNLPVSNIVEGNFTPSRPKTFENGIIQIGGAIFANLFGNGIDASPFLGSGVKGLGNTYGELLRKLTLLPQLMQLYC